MEIGVVLVDLSGESAADVGVAVECRGIGEKMVIHLVSSRWEVLTACRLPGCCWAGTAVVRWLSSLHWV